jgi:hypothetical protein
MWAHFYIPRAFQWYKEPFNSMSFDPYNCPLKIQESIRTPTSKVEAHLKVWGSFPHTLLHSREYEMWLLGSLLAHTFASPCLGHKPKAGVATPWIMYQMCTCVSLYGMDFITSKESCSIMPFVMFVMHPSKVHWWLGFAFVYYIFTFFIIQCDVVTIFYLCDWGERFCL